MSKLIDTASLDACLNDIDSISAAGGVLHITSGDPADRATAIANSLANVATPATTGPSTITNGRRLTVNQNTDVPVTATGTAATVCGIDATSLKCKTDAAAPVALTNGEQVTQNAFNIDLTVTP